MGRPQLDPKRESPGSAFERPPQEGLFSLRLVLFRPRWSGALCRRELLSAERPAVRREQGAAGFRVVALSAAGVLPGEKHRFGGDTRYDAEKNNRGGDQRRSQPVIFHDDAPPAVRATNVTLT